MLSLRHSIGNVSPLESLARGSKSVPHFRCYASPPPTEICARCSLGASSSSSPHSTCLFLLHCAEECCQRPCQLGVLLLVYLIESGGYLYSLPQVLEGFHTIGRLLNVHLHRIEETVEFSECYGCSKRCHNRSDVIQGIYSCLVIHVSTILLLLQGHVPRHVLKKSFG